MINEIHELNRRLINECRCDERLKAKSEGSTRLTYTGLRLTYVCRCDERLKVKTEYTGLSDGLEHLKIETRLKNEMFASVMGECDLDDTGTPSIFKIIHCTVTLARILTIFDFIWAENTTRW